MDTQKLNALITLFDDDDPEVIDIVEKELRSLGGRAPEILEKYWEQHDHNPRLQERLEDLLHSMQLETVESRLRVWKNSGSENLLEGLWAVATLHHPQLTLQELQTQVQEIQLEVWLNLRDDLHPIDQVNRLNHVFFDKFGFEPNAADYHSPSNSMINQVLTTRRGNPISLSAIYLLVAQKNQLPMYGVNLPNHFVLTYKIPNYQFYINVFNKGAVLSRQEVETFVKSMKIEPQEGFFEPCSHLEIVQRFLRNLALSYEKNDQPRQRQYVYRLLQVLQN